MNFLPIIGDVLDKIIPDKAEREKAKHELALMQQSGDVRKFEARFNAIIMEARSKDPWTSRARPSFLYVIYIYLLGALPIGILSIWSPASATEIAAGMQAWLAAIPGEMWALFGAGYLGYSGLRSRDKAKILEAEK